MIKVTLHKVVYCPSTRYHLSRAAEVPEGLPLLGLTLSQYTRLPVAGDLVVERVGLDAASGVYLILEEQAPSKDIPASWFLEHYGEGWEVKGMPACEELTAEARRRVKARELVKKGAA